MKAGSKREDLLRDMGDGEFLKTDGEILEAYTVQGKRPWAVVFPESAEQAAEVIRLAAAEKWAVVPWGGGTKMGMGKAPARLDLVVSTERLNRILDLDAANLSVTAQAGVKFKNLQTALADQENRCYFPLEAEGAPSKDTVCSERANMGCFVPLWPPHIETATVGGVLAANTSGPMRLLYGTPRDVVLGIRYVGAAGSIVSTGGKTVKNVSGYDMGKLLIGSMGTLGLFCDITLRLLPIPERRQTVVVAFKDLVLARSVAEMLTEGALSPAAVEIVQGRNAGSIPLDGFSGDDGVSCHLCVALEGVEEPVERMAGEIQSAAARCEAKSVILEEPEHIRFWNAYSDMKALLRAQAPIAASAKANFPISEYSGLLEKAHLLSEEFQVDYLAMVRAGSGTAHFYLFGDEDAQADPAGLETMLAGLLDYCYARGGNLVLEDAEPMLEQMPPWGHPRQDLLVMKRIKEQLDPQGVFSPGRFVGDI